jgi:GDPmannose 4,6-dehydratase
MKKALITGITGMDGSHLAEFLLEKGYEVHGIIRRTSTFNTSRINHIFDKLKLHYGDVTDPLVISNLVSQIQPDEIYNLAAQSHVKVSFEIPYYTAQVDGLGTLAILEAVKNHCPKARVYQASTSELYGGMNYNMPETGYTEESIMHPRSPYGVAKLYAHWITINYRETYKIFACNGILFNHESPVRGETFVTKKIVRGLCRIHLGLQKKIYLGNLYAKRDWGHAKDYVEGMWKIMQQKKPDDFVLATGKQYTVKHFANLVMNRLGFKYYWKGKGVKEKCFDYNGKCIIECDKEYIRPLEVDTLLGNPTKARRVLKWKPKYNIITLIEEMVAKELQSFDDK